MPKALRVNGVPDLKPDASPLTQGYPGTVTVKQAAQVAGARAIAEPIVHILRNAVDHGMESADERVLAGKPSGGTITLTVCRDNDHVEIVIADDGRVEVPDFEKGGVSQRCPPVKRPGASAPRRRIPSEAP